MSISPSAYTEGWSIAVNRRKENSVNFKGELFEVG